MFQNFGLRREGDAMAMSETQLLSLILTVAEQFRVSSASKKMSAELALLAAMQVYADPKGTGVIDASIDPAEWGDLEAILQTGLTDAESARQALETYIAEHAAESEDSQRWNSLVQTLHAAASRMEMENITAGLLVRAILATEPDCIRPFLSAVAEENDRKADMMFADSLEELEGAGDFQAFIREVKQMAPVLQRYQAEHTLTDQVILLSVDRDGGVETYLQMLQDLYKEEKLRQFDAEPFMIPLPFQFMPDGSSILERVALDKIESCVLCFDIAEWVESIEHDAFEDFLLKLKNVGDKYIYVFRMPYAEDTVCRRVAAIIQDIFPLRVIRIAPWSPAYTNRIALRCLRRSGFTAEEAAMKIFAQRLREEKRDGRFYGYQTIKKITDEMVYRKLMQISDQASEVADGDTDDRTICAGDVCGLSQTSICGEDQGYLTREIFGRKDQIRELSEVVRALKRKRETRRGLIFEGEAGTGKSSAAEYFAQLLKNSGLVEDADLRTCKLSDLEGVYDGTTTAEVLRILRDSAGGVLYIDVATEPEEDLSGFDEEQQNRIRARVEAFRAVAMHTLLAQLLANRHAGIVILSGPAHELDTLQEHYPELKNLFFDRIVFPEYNVQELAELYLNLVDADGIPMGNDVAICVREYFKQEGDKLLAREGFTHARYISNLVHHTWSKAQVRCEMEACGTIEVLPCDFLLAAADSSEELNRKEHEDRSIGFIQRR